MKNKWLIWGGIGLIVVVMSAVIVFVMRNGHSSDTTTSNGQSSGTSSSTARDRGRTTTRITNNFKDVSACTVFTLADAQRVLGNEAEAATTNGIGDTENNGIHTTNCGYALGADNVNNITTVNVMVRAAYDKTGAIANENEFSILKAGGATTVPGYGDAAYWNQQMGQLNVKVENNWYIISNTKGSRPGTGDLQHSKAVADQIASKL